MQRNPKNIAAAAAIGGTVFFALLYAPVGAYSINNNTGNVPSIPAQNAGGTTGGFGDLFAPFQNFIKSINSVGTNAVEVNVPSVPQNNPLAAGAENWLQSQFRQFDDWLYGIAGFHISGFFVAILNILSWLLGIVKSVVDWLLGLLH